MYKRLMAPVDLNHIPALGKALRVAADLSRHCDAPACYVGVTSPQPSRLAHNPAEYADRLRAFAREQANAGGHAATSHAMTSHDPSIDLERALLRAVDETGADLVAVASHVPGLADRFWPSNGGSLARHAKASVRVVRSAA